MRLLAAITPYKTPTVREGLPHSTQRGITLLEMLIVVTIIALLAGISYPSLSRSIESLRLNSAARQVAGFTNTAMSRAERLQDAVELMVSKADNSLEARSLSGGYRERIQLGRDIHIVSVQPESPAGDETDIRTFVVYPGGAPPAFGIELENNDGRRRSIALDPITGAPQIKTVEAPAPGS